MKKLAALFLMAAAFAVCAKDIVLEDFKDLNGWADPKKGATVVSFEAAKGQGPSTMDAMKINQPGTAVKSYGKNPPLPVENWQKRYEGISFKVKGDGSDQWGCITLNGWGLAGGNFYFPLKSTEWQTYKVSFADMAPVSDHVSEMPRSLSVYAFGELKFGDRWSICSNNAKIPNFSYLVSDVRLEENVTPVFQRGKFKSAPFADIAKKMKSGQPVSIICFGDSITAGTGLKKNLEEQYAVLTGEILRQNFKNDKITSRSVAVGGAHTLDLLGWMERDLSQGMPDIATVLIGYNNRSGAQNPEVYRAQLEMWIERILFKTQGKAAIVLIPTVPGVPRFVSQDDYARITREVAAKYKLLVAPIDQKIKEIGPKDYKEIYLCDSVHPNAEGHKMFAEVLAKTIIDASSK